MKPRKPRKKKCKICKQWFQPEYKFNSTITPSVCSVKCSIEKVFQDKEKKKRKELRQKKEDSLTISQRIVRARKAFQEYIRARDTKYFRDRGQEPACICCLRTDAKSWHGGHFMSVGSRPELQFHQYNCHLQSGQCNYFESQSDSNYRENLIAKVGIEMVEYLENYHSSHKWIAEEIEEIREHYKELLKGLNE